MEISALLIALYLLAAWTWIFLARVADYGLPASIRLQQRMGMYTPRPFYRVAGRGKLLAGGVAAIGLAGLLTGCGTETAVGLLVIAIALLTYLFAGMGKLLHPRFVDAVVARLDTGENQCGRE